MGYSAVSTLPALGLHTAYRGCAGRFLPFPGMRVALDFREQGPDSSTEGVETEGAEQEVEVQGVDSEQRLALTLQKSGLLQGASYRQGRNRRKE